MVVYILSISAKPYIQCTMATFAMRYLKNDYPLFLDAQLFLQCTNCRFWCVYFLGAVRALWRPHSFYSYIIF